MSEKNDGSKPDNSSEGERILGGCRRNESWAWQELSGIFKNFLRISSFSLSEYEIEDLSQDLLGHFIQNHVVETIDVPQAFISFCQVCSLHKAIDYIRWRNVRESWSYNPPKDQDMVSVVEAAPDSRPRQDKEYVWFKIWMAVFNAMKTWRDSKCVELLTLYFLYKLGDQSIRDLKDIAKATGIPESYVSKSISRCLEKLSNIPEVKSALEEL